MRRKIWLIPFKTFANLINFKALTILVLLIAISIPVQSQDMGAEVFKYLPLRTGNFWQFESMEHLPRTSGDTTIYAVESIEITGDTLMPNGQSYFIFDTSQLQFYNGFPEYVRIDSMQHRVMVYDTLDRYITTEPSEIDSETVWFNLGTEFPPGTDTTYSFPDNIEYHIFSGIAPLGNIQDSVRTQIYNWYEGGQNTISLAKNIGFSEIDWGELGFDIFRTLIYARINGQEYGRISGTETKSTIPKKIQLLQNYPNPFNPSTTIQYDLPKAAEVSLRIYNLQGQLITTLFDNTQPAGYHQVLWDGTDQFQKPVASGVYFCRMVTPYYTKTVKMMLVR